MEKHRLDRGVTHWDDREVHGLQGLFPLQNLLRKPCAGISALPEIEEPIRAELFSSERLEQHAESLAATQQVTATPRKGRRLLPRVLDNGSCPCWLRINKTDLSYILFVSGISRS